MYSARTLPFWSSAMYLANCEHSVRAASKGSEGSGSRTHVADIGDDCRVTEFSLQRCQRRASYMRESSGGDSP